MRIGAFSPYQPVLTAQAQRQAPLQQAQGTDGVRFGVRKTTYHPAKVVDRLPVEGLPGQIVMSGPKTDMPTQIRVIHFDPASQKYIVLVSLNDDYSPIPVKDLSYYLKARIITDTVYGMLFDDSIDQAPLNRWRYNETYAFLAGLTRGIADLQHRNIKITPTQEDLDRLEVVWNEFQEYFDFKSGKVGFYNTSNNTGIPGNFYPIGTVTEGRDSYPPYDYYRINEDLPALYDADRISRLSMGGMENLHVNKGIYPLNT